jgi:hypothetical protein
VTERCLCLCEQAHLRLARGRSGREPLDEAERITAALGLTPRSELARALGRVQRAQALFEAGRTDRLLRGECLEDLPAGLRRWLAETAHAEGMPGGTRPGRIGAPAGRQQGRGLES